MVPAARQLIPLLLLSLLLPAFGAGGYYVSYRIHTERFLPVHEHLYVTKAMAPIDGPLEPLCRFLTDAKSFEAFAREEPRLLEECLFPEGVRVRSWERIENGIDAGSHLLMIVPPTPIKVDFNDGLVIIYKVRSKK